MAFTLGLFALALGLLALLPLSLRLLTLLLLPLCLLTLLALTLLLDLPALLLPALSLLALSLGLLALSLLPLATIFLRALLLATVVLCALPLALRLLATVLLLLGPPLLDTFLLATFSLGQCALFAHLPVALGMLTIPGVLGAFLTCELAAPVVAFSILSLSALAHGGLATLAPPDFGTGKAGTTLDTLAVPADFAAPLAIIRAHGFAICPAALYVAFRTVLLADQTGALDARAIIAAFAIKARGISGIAFFTPAIEAVGGNAPRAALAFPAAFGGLLV